MRCQSSIAYDFGTLPYIQKFENLVSRSRSNCSKMTVMSNIFELTSRPTDDVFAMRRDPNDPRMGEVVSRDPNDYPHADIVVLGCPQDDGVRRNGGRIGAAAAPNAIRKQFYRLTPMNIKKRIFDVGDTDVSGSLEEIHDRQTEIIRKILSDGKRIVVLGGGNDISYADGRAMADVYSR